MKISLKRLAFGIASAGLLTIYGCGGGGGGDAPLAATPITVAPSLGKFSLGTPVKLTKPDGTELASGSLGADGKYTFSLTGYTGPVVVEVLGGANVQYYDEGTKTMTAFGAGKKLRAMMPKPQTEVGVTALTNAAVIKLDLAGTLKTATASTVDDANTTVTNALKTLLGLTGIDILQAPTLVDGNTGKNLKAASVGDKYAIALAAFAKTASGTNAKTGLPNDASDAAEALANDLKDGNLDGKDTTTATPTTITGYDRATITTNYKAATSDLAEAASETVLNQTYDANLATSSSGSSSGTPTSQPGTGGGSATVPVTGQTDLDLAKAMFAELRTTLNSFANGNKTGFLDTQATSMNADLNANVAPEMAKVANRISALGNAMRTFEDAAAYTSGNTLGFVSGSSPFTKTTTLLRQRGDLLSVWYGYGSSDYCWTDSATGVSSKVTCAHADSNSVDWANNKIKMVFFELTRTATNQYTYTATRYNEVVTISAGTNWQPMFAATPTVVTQDSNGNLMPSGSGTVAKTVSGSTVTGLEITGTLPPSASTTVTTSLCSSGMGPTCTLTSSNNLVTTGVDNIAVSVARTALTANTYNYALTGSVSTTKLGDATKVVTLSLDSGSYFNTDETPATSPKLIAAKFMGTAQTAATKFTGSLDVGSFATSKNNEFSPTSIVFNGSINDIRPSIGIGQILTGKLEATVTDYANFDSSLAESSTNYLHAKMTFTGTVQAPSRPLLKLVVAAAKTGVATGDVTLNYSYGSNISITGSGTMAPSGNTLVLSNQDGIQFGITANQATIPVTKSGTTLATITNGVINYIDGVTESLN